MNVRELYWKWRSDPLGLTRLRAGIRRRTRPGSALSNGLLLISGKTHVGWCPICEEGTRFLIEGDWLRDEYRCRKCRSIPRFRHLVHVLRKQVPNYRDLRIHECSPHGPVYRLLKRDCADYVATHFFPDVRLGDFKDGFRCENLEALTFDDEGFDVTITQDVLEHVLDPAAAFREIARTLKPGGTHIFTVPWYAPKATFVRAAPSAEGVVFYAPKDYHGNPIDADGALVVTEWGTDLPDFIYRHSGMTTTVFVTRDKSLGLDGEFLEVFVSRKPK